VGAEKHLQELLEGDEIGIVVDLHCFRMIPDVVIGWVVCGTPRVPDPGTNDSWQLPKLGIRAPESPKRKGGGLDFGIRALLPGLGSRGRRPLFARVTGTAGKARAIHQHRSQYDKELSGFCRADHLY
jgi:hypothetical protein